MAGSEVTVMWGHNVESTAITDADGRYTASSPRRNGIQVEFGGVAALGLASTWYGAQPWGAATELNVRGHVVGIDGALPRRFKVSGKILDQTGSITSVQIESSMFVPRSWCGWCFGLPEPSSVGITYRDNVGEYEIELGEGTWRLFFNTQYASVDPRAASLWWPNGLTVYGAKDIVVDRDLTGIDITLPKAVRITGKVTVEPGGVPLVEAMASEGGGVRWHTGEYAFHGVYTMYVAPGTYRIRTTCCSWDSDAWYHPNVRSFEAAAPVIAIDKDIVADIGPP